MLAASMSSSNLSTGLRKVQLSDRELFERVQQIKAPSEPVNIQGLSSQHGWKHMRTGVSRMEMCIRVMRVHTTTTPFQTRQCQVVTGGEMRARTSELLALLRAPTECESNSLMHALYGSRFIYISLLHALSNPERGSLQSRGNTIATLAAGQQLMVRTASFVRSGLVSPFKRRSSSSDGSTHQCGRHGGKNEQCCYIEQLTPTQEGFKLVFCSIDATEVTAGKAPPECVIALHPISGWFIAEPTHDNPATLQFTFQAAFLGHIDGSCDFLVAQDRLLFLGKGICRLEKVLRQRQHRCLQPHTTPERVWRTILTPFRALGVSNHESAGSTIRNWHCIACTGPFLPALRKRRRRCDLCAYRVCAESRCLYERVTIYNRYAVSLLICTRCRECINEPDSGNQIGRYADFTEREQGLSSRRHNRLTSSIAHRSSGGTRMIRRTQSEPPLTTAQNCMLGTRRSACLKCQ